MVLDAVSNFVRGETDAAVDSTQTTVSVVDASIFPDPSSDGEFNVVIWDVNSHPRPDQDPDVEILRVTAVDTGNNDLTVTRGQETTTGASHPSGSAVHLSPTAKMFGDIEDTFADFWDAGAQELTADVNNQSVKTGDINSNINGEAVQASISGLVVPVGDGVGVGDAVDPNNTTTPVQDAMDKVPNGPGFGGAVLLPPGEVQEEGPITQRSKVSIIGHGVGGEVGGGDPAASEIFITNSGSASAIEVTSTCEGFHWKSFGIIGDQSEAFTDCISVEDTVVNWGFDNLTVNQWRGRVYNGTTNPDGGSFQMDAGSILVGGVDAEGSQLFRFGTGPDNRIREIKAYPSSDQSGSDSDIILQETGELVVDQMNIGGAAAGIWGCPSGNGPIFKLVHTNYEPAVNNGTVYSLIQDSTTRRVHVGTVRINDAQNVVDVSNFVACDVESESYYGRPILTSGATVNNKVVVSTDITGDNALVYEGFGSDVNNVSGSSLTNGVSCLADQTLVTS